MEGSAEDLEGNLRLFAIRKAAASKEYSDLKSRVVVSVQSRNCPMHGGHNTKNGRKEMARELRLSAAREAKEAREARERSIEVSSHQSRRGSSLEPLRSYNSMPRRFSASPASLSSGPKIGRNGSFQDLGYNNPPFVKKDQFTPRVEFKNTLRQFNPKDDERSRSSLASSQRSRHDSEPMDYHDSNAYFTQQLTAHNPYAQNPKRNYIENNSGPASLPIINTKSKLRLDLNSSRPQTPIKSPTGSRPQSPRRVEFSDEIFFDFGRNHHNNYNVQRSNSTDLPLVTKAKPILRNTTSDSSERVISHSSRSNNGFINTSESNLSLIEQYEQQQGNHSLPEPLSPLVIEHTNLETSANCSEDINRRKLSNDDSLVQIYVPENNHESDDETLSNGSQDTVVKNNVVKRTMSAEVTSDTKQRTVPPMLNEWNRSQSFPPPKNLSLFESDGLQKLSSKDDGKTQN